MKVFPVEKVPLRCYYFGYIDKEKVTGEYLDNFKEVTVKGKQRMKAYKIREHFMVYVESKDSFFKLPVPFFADFIREKANKVFVREDKGFMEVTI